MSLPNDLEDACENIDASIFSGDLLYSYDNLKEFEEYLYRWNRAIAEHKAIFAEEYANE